MSLRGTSEHSAKGGNEEFLTVGTFNASEVINNLDVAIQRTPSRVRVIRTATRSRRKYDVVTFMARCARLDYIG